MARKWRILSLDGGGVRGIVTLEVLAYIETSTGKRISELFDLIVGTSTGGLIAMGLAKNGALTASQILDVYRSSCPRIFDRSAWQKLKSLAQLAGPKYSNDALYRCAMGILGGRSRLGDARTGCMVTTYNIAKRTPRFLTSWDTPDVLMVDAAMMTSAAPTYFAPWNDHVDGGVCDNNPALSGVIEWCRRQGCNVRDCFVVSVGTGSDAKPYSGEAAAKWGLLTWAEPLISIFTDGTSELHAYHLKRLLQDADVMRFQIPVSGTMADMDNADLVNLAALSTLGAQLMCAQGADMNRLIDVLSHDE